MAQGWDRERKWVWESSRRVGEWMVAALDPKTGQTILELAAGTGETGFAAVDRIGPKGHLISTDFSPNMVEAARRESDFLVRRLRRLRLRRGWRFLLGRWLLRVDGRHLVSPIR
jgi:SAM-dependent methyltransferase